jgi:hypothetical protein
MSVITCLGYCFSFLFSVSFFFVIYFCFVENRFVLSPNLRVYLFKVCIYIITNQPKLENNSKYMNKNQSIKQKKKNVLLK